MKKRSATVSYLAERLGAVRSLDRLHWSVVLVAPLVLTGMLLMSIGMIGLRITSWHGLTFLAGGGLAAAALLLLIAVNSKRYKLVHSGKLEPYPIRCNPIDLVLVDVSGNAPRVTAAIAVVVSVVVGVKMHHWLIDVGYVVHSAHLYAGATTFCLLVAAAYVAERLWRSVTAKYWRSDVRIADLEHANERRKYLKKFG